MSQALDEGPQASEQKCVGNPCHSLVMVHPPTLHVLLKPRLLLQWLNPFPMAWPISKPFGLASDPSRSLAYFSFSLMDSFMFLLSFFTCHVYAIELRITTVSVCHICSACPCLLHSITFQAFTDTPCAVSHGVPWLALHPRASQPPWPCLHAWVLVCTALVYFWLVTQLVFPIHIYVTM